MWLALTSFACTSMELLRISPPPISPVFIFVMHGSAFNECIKFLKKQNKAIGPDGFVSAFTLNVREQTQSQHHHVGHPSQPHSLKD